MAGHSKWANIQYRKRAQDAKRGKVFTRVIREITIAAREGGGDPTGNAQLRLALDRAKAANVPNDTVDRAIKKATGELEGVHYEEVRYEGYAPGGVAVMVDCLTDNKNRTVAAVRHAFSKHGGTLGTDGSVSYLFTKLGILTFAPGTDEDRVIEAALEAGALDVVKDADGVIEVTTEPDDFEAVREALAARGLEPEEADVTMNPATRVELEVDAARSVLKLLEVLEELDDTQDVYSNAEIPAEAYEDES